MRDDELFDETVAQRTALVEVLDGLIDADWDRASLCVGWRIREVVAHVTLPYRHSVPSVLWAMLRARGQFDVAADRLARHDTATRPPSALLNDLRRNVDHRWRPPGGGQMGALSHDVIHGLDITEALRRQSVSPASRVVEVLRGTSLTRAFGVDPVGHRLRCTDADYAVGEGDTVDLLAKDVLLIVTGRRPVPSGT